MRPGGRETHAVNFFEQRYEPTVRTFVPNEMEQNFVLLVYFSKDQSTGVSKPVGV